MALGVAREPRSKNLQRGLPARKRRSARPRCCATTMVRRSAHPKRSHWCARRAFFRFDSLDRAVEPPHRDGRGQDGGAGRRSTRRIACRRQRRSRRSTSFTSGLGELALTRAVPWKRAFAIARNDAAHRGSIPGDGDDGPGVVRTGTGHAATLKKRAPVAEAAE